MAQMMGALEGQGCRFLVGDASTSPPDFTEGTSPPAGIEVGLVTAIRDLRSGTAAEIDVTHLGSDAKEFLIGLKDEGTMSLDLFFNQADAGQAALSALRNSRQLGVFRIELNDGSPPSTFTFYGRVTQFPFSIAVDAALTGTVSIRISGEIVES